MASGKRASMREGPLAALFRKTEEAQETPQPPPAEPPPRQRRARARGRGAPPAPRTPTPQERLRHAFSSDLPENMMSPPGAACRVGGRVPSGVHRWPTGRASARAARGRRRRRRRQRRQPHDRGRGRPASSSSRSTPTRSRSAVLGRARDAADRRRHHPRPGLGLRPGSRPHRGDGGLRPRSRRCSRARTWCSSPRARAAAPAPAPRRSSRAWRASSAR